MPSEPSSFLISHRYRLHEQLGSGGMGVVYRATDRLSGQCVALKSVLSRSSQGGPVSSKEQAALRLALAQEFQVLATLRHPNIVGVLDYGFSLDAARQPYFTMDLLENARTILEMGRGQPLAVQIDLLVQMLQALAYLHRRRIIHRDLKPSNVLVIATPDESNQPHRAGLIKLLDFGISLATERSGGTSGTLAYMAPEVLDGQPISIAADLYAVGVMAYELWVGRHPFNTHSLPLLLADIMNTDPEIESVGLEPQFAVILKKLLAKEPRARYAGARQVIEALSQAVGQPLPTETKTTRESFLQAAHFVGRKTELEHLSGLLADTLSKKGAAWLVGGESGVGKSRLLDELRPLALVQGMLVLRGQAMREVGTPYQLWQAPLRRLSLLVELDDLAASVLKTLIPDLPALLERDIAAAPALDPQTTQARLTMVIEDIFRRYLQQQPVLLILEDLQWVGNESLALLSRLSRMASTSPLLIIGSYRDDERPELRQVLAELQVLKLERLNRHEIIELSESMLGQVTLHRDLLDLLQRETEGNVFFLVEVMRVLAEEAGQLDRISQINLPAHIIAGGVERVIHHRLTQLAEADRPLLHLAAIMGRQLDLPVLHSLEPEIELEGWLTRFAEAAVLDVQEDRWRFAHDKLRAALVAGLSVAEQQALYRRVAGVIESLYGDSAEQAAGLAYHWGAAGDLVKEAHYAALAGEQALQSGAHQEAITFLERALTLAAAPDGAGSKAAPEGDLLEQVRLQRQLGEAHLGSGNMPAGRLHLEQALAWLGWPVPHGRWRLWGSLWGQFVRQVLHLIWPARFLGQAKNKAIFLEASHIGVALGLIYYLTRETGLLLAIGLRTLNLGELAGPSPELARSYGNMCVIAGLIPMHALARVYRRRAQETAAQIQQLSARAWVLTVTGVYSAGVGHWNEAQTALEQAVTLCERVGDRRRWEESLSQGAMVYLLQGQFTQSAVRYSDVYASAYDRGDPQLQVWGLNGIARCLLTFGQVEQALDLLDLACCLLAEEVGPLSAINTYGTLALTYLRRGDAAQARQAADRVAQLTGQSSRSSYYVLQGHACVAEVYLSLWQKQLVVPMTAQSTGRESYVPTGHPTNELPILPSNDSTPPHPHHLTTLQSTAQWVCTELHRFAKIFPIAQPQAWLWQGVYDRLAGRPAQARRAWQKSLAAAEKLAMPYEQGLACYHLGLAANDQARQAYLNRACELFTRLGASFDLERVQAALEIPS